MIGPASLPSTVQMFAPTPKPQIGLGDWSIARPSLDQVEVKIREDYLLRIGQGTDAVSIHNINTGHTTTIDRNLGVDINKDAQPDYQFWGAITLKLNSGEKVTIHTEAETQDINVAREVRKVSVSSPEAGLLAADFSDTLAKPLDVFFTQDGPSIDRALKDNFIIQEARDGAGWVRGKQVVNQSVLNATALGKYYGSGNNRLSFGQVFTGVINSISANMFSLTFHITGFECGISRADDVDEASGLYRERLNGLHLFSDVIAEPVTLPDNNKI